MELQRAKQMHNSQFECLAQKLTRNLDFKFPFSHFSIFQVPFFSIHVEMKLKVAFVVWVGMGVSSWGVGGKQMDMKERKKERGRNRERGREGKRERQRDRERI